MSNRVNYSRTAKKAFEKLIDHLISRKTIAWIACLIITIISFIYDRHFESCFYGFITISTIFIGADLGQRYMENKIGGDDEI